MIPVNEAGDTVIVMRVADDEGAEALVHALTVASRNLVWVADHALPWAAFAGRGDLRRHQPRRASRRSDARRLVEWEERYGFTRGELELAGEAADDGSIYRVWSQNENLLAWRDGAPDVTTPDLICCFSAETGEPVTNPRHEPGAAATVVGIPAAAQWRTPAGVATLGPRHFGFDVDYVPLEKDVRRV